MKFIKRVYSKGSDYKQKIPFSYFLFVSVRGWLITKPM